MNPSYLIPNTEPIPARVEFFIFLEQLFFLIHIIIINIIVGTSLIIFYKSNKTPELYKTDRDLTKKIPILFALGINMGIPALLFLQVVFGHLFYTSSILMGTFWILIIPFLIIAYYGSYFYYKKAEISNLAKPALITMIIMIFYIGFMFVNNLSMMEMPEKWEIYFSNKDGTILLWNIQSIYPRFLHFLVASVAIGGIAYSVYYNYKKNSEDKVREGLKIFAYATILQIGIGLWFLLSLRQDIMLKYIGEDLVATVFLISGIVTTLISLFYSLKSNLRLTVIFLGLTLLSMVINRYNLRIFQLGKNFDISHLKISAQYDVFVIFVGILILGIAVIVYMLRIAFPVNKRADR